MTTYPCHVYTCNRPDGMFLYVNAPNMDAAEREAARVLGCDPADCICRYVKTILAPPPARLVRKAVTA